jgi:hypothetical protein
VLSDPILPDAFSRTPDPVRTLTQAYTEKFEECVRPIPTSGSGFTTAGRRPRRSPRRRPSWPPVMSRREKRWLLYARPIQFLLYLALRAVVMVVHMFPYRAARDIGRLAGRMLYAVDRKHVRIAAKNLHRTRGICAPDEVPAFILRVYQHFGQSLVEVLMMSRSSSGMNSCRSSICARRTSTDA